MKTLEMNKKSRIKSRGVLTKLLLSQLLSAVEYQTLYQFNAWRDFTFTQWSDIKYIQFAYHQY